ncbi:MAG TPA: MFS transporter, partial [Thermoplasmata archaeon]|nr:MFS transporter [Thermoplasmata archaeon]
MAEPLATESAWAALATPAFRALWVAALVSNLGTWIQDVGEVWTMTSLTSSPFLIALVETATTFPVFALAIPA